jgi:hypothetical protein
VPFGVSAVTLHKWLVTQPITIRILQNAAATRDFPRRHRRLFEINMAFALEKKWLLDVMHPIQWLLNSVVLSLFSIILL